MTPSLSQHQAEKSVAGHAVSEVWPTGQADQTLVVACLRCPLPASSLPGANVSLSESEKGEFEGVTGWARYRTHTPPSRGQQPPPSPPPKNRKVTQPEPRLISVVTSPTSPSLRWVGVPKPCPCPGCVETSRWDCGHHLMPFRDLVALWGLGTEAARVHLFDEIGTVLASQLSGSFRSCTPPCCRVD